MPYNFAAESFHTKKLCSKLSSREVHFSRKKWPICVFEPTLEGGGLGAKYDVHLTLIELFSLGVTAEQLRANID